MTRSSSRPSCRAASSIGSVGRPPLPRRSARVAMMLLLLAAASCAKKPVAAPVVPGAPKFADFVFPAGPSTLAPEPTWERYRAAWNVLQSGDPKAAEREFGAIVKTTPGFYPADAALGYAALARKDAQAAAGHFDRALSAAPAYAPALAGRGEALLALGRTEPALEAYESALAADASLTAVRSRIDVLKFRTAQQNI